MPTKAQINANRENAKKSTGPRTEEGKARASQNSLRHGLLARDAVLPGEDPAVFDRQLATLEDDLRPTNSLEFELVRQLADTQHRLRRLARLESGFLAACRDRTRRHIKHLHPDRVPQDHEGETTLLGEALIDRSQGLGHLARYDAHLSRRFFRAFDRFVALRLQERQSRERFAEAQKKAEAAQDPDRGRSSSRRRYVPAQAPPPIDATNPEQPNIGFRPSPISGSQGGARLRRAALGLRPSVRRAGNEPIVIQTNKLRHGPNQAELKWNQGVSPQSIPAFAPSHGPLETRYGTPNASEGPI